MKNIDKFKNRLRELRKENNMTQQELANKIGIVRTSITNYETGRAVPDSETLNLIANSLNTTTDYLLGRTDIRNPYDGFIEKAKVEYGSKGKKQAENLLDGIQAMFDGGELPDEDKDEFFRAITEIYFESKKKNKKYTPRKYRKTK